MPKRSHPRSDVTKDDLPELFNHEIVGQITVAGGFEDLAIHAEDDVIPDSDPNRPADYAA